MTAPPEDDLVLAAEFPAASREEWRALVAKIVARSGGGAPDAAGDGTAVDPEDALASRTADGIRIAPLYVDGDAPGPLGYPGLAPFTRGRTAGGARAGWDVRPRHANPDAKAAHGEILEDLTGGATSLWLVLGEAGIPVGDLPTVLDEVLLDVIAITLDAGSAGREAAEAYLTLAQKRGIGPEALTGCLGLDPLGVLARTGSDAGLAEGLADAAALAARCAGSATADSATADSATADRATADRAGGGPAGLRAVAVDALAFHDAGATDAQELGASLAAGVAYLRALTDAGLTVPQALGQLEFRYAATADQFATTAKLRAARRVWARVAQECGVTGDGAGQRQHAVTSWPMTTRRDPWTNMLRATLACFGACVGGADSVTVLPFDAALGLPDPLARRIARNTPALLVEESHIAAVIDPAGGSWYTEALTEELAAAAWTAFREIESAGGLVDALRSGLVGERIGAARDARRAAIDSGAETVLGVNAFPLEGETLLDRVSAAAPPDPSTGSGLPRIRWAQPSEDAWQDEQGAGSRD